MTNTVVDASKRFELLLPRTSGDFELYGSVAAYLMVSRHKVVAKESSPEFMEMLHGFFDGALDETTPAFVFKEAEKALTEIINEKLAKARDPTKKAAKGANFMRVDGDVDVNYSDDDEPVAKPAHQPSRDDDAEVFSDDDDGDIDEVMDQAAVQKMIEEEKVREKAWQERREAEAALAKEKAAAAAKDKELLESRQRRVEATVAAPEGFVVKKDDFDDFGKGKGKAKGGKRR
jgi:hypothetical protein